MSDSLLHPLQALTLRRLHRHPERGSRPTRYALGLARSFRRRYVDRLLARHRWRAGRWLDVGGAWRRGLPVPRTVANLVAEVRPTIITDAHDLPHPDQSFDGVICLEVLQYVRDPRRVMDEIRRVMKPGAQLVLVTPGPLYYARAGTSLHSFSEVQLRQVCSQLGLSVVQYRSLGGVGAQLADEWRGYMTGYWSARLNPIDWLILAIYWILMRCERSGGAPLDPSASVGSFLVAERAG